MRIGLFYLSRPALCRGYTIAGRLGVLARAWVLALAALFLAAGAGQAQAAAALPAAGGSLAFTAPNVNGVIGGPLGTKVTAQGSGWTPFVDVTLSLSSQPQDCTKVTSLGTYGTDASGAFSINFVWPSYLTQVGAYYLCGTQINGATKNTSYSANSFNLLSSAPASVAFSANTVAPGGTITLTGSNWLPGPQTITMVLVPCNIGCAQPQAGKVTVVTGTGGSFVQPVTISSKAPLGAYYVQAANADGTLSASAGPIQVATPVVPTATLAPGTTATAAPTSTPPGAGTGTPTSDNKTALKDGLLAGGLGLLVLLVMVGGGALLLSRMRSGPDLSRFEKVNEQRLSADPWSDGVGQHSRRGYSGPPGGSQGRPDASYPLSRRPKDEDEQPKPAGAASSEGFTTAESYPWQRPRNAPFGLPPAPGGRGSPAEDDSTRPAQRPPVDYP